MNGKLRKMQNCSKAGNDVDKRESETKRERKVVKTYVTLATMWTAGLLCKMHR